MMTLPEIFDRNARSRNHDRSAVADIDDRWLLMRMTDELIDRLQSVRRDFKSVLIIGNCVDKCADLMTKRGLCVSYAGPGHSHGGTVCEEDELPFPAASFDLILSIGTLDTVNDLPGALVQIRRILKPGGLFLGAMMGAGSLSRLRSILSEIEPGVARHHPQIDVRAAGDLLARAGFVLPVADCESITIRYSSFQRLVSDLRANALTNVLKSRLPMTRAVHGAATEVFNASDRQETLAMIYMTGWAPSE